MENMDQILDAPEVEKQQLEYAGFWIRVGAYVIDGILLGIVGFILGAVLGDSIPEAVGSIINLILGLGYFALMEASENQATLGKMAVGVKVGDYNGEQITVPNAIGRYFAKILSALLMGIGFMMAGWDDKKQALHDKLASTYVFYK